MPLIAPLDMHAMRIPTQTAAWDQLVTSSCREVPIATACQGLMLAVFPQQSSTTVWIPAYQHVGADGDLHDAICPSPGKITLSEPLPHCLKLSIGVVAGSSATKTSA